MKKLSLVLTLVLFVVGFTTAQRTLTGSVVDENGEPLIGATILVKNTSRGTVTDVDGTFSIDVPETEQSVLVVSYTGYESKEVAVGEAVDNLTVELSSTVEELTEVVVTGLGIEREKKALGYAVTTLSSRDIQARPEGDVARLLRGKAPGVDITQTSGMAGTGTNVIIRGYSSITGSNQPLFVIDGVPFNTSTNNDEGFTTGGATASSRFLDLDPNNIEEVSILKGLSATVLYGEAGRNGVILITTKNGKAGADLDKKTEVRVIQSVTRTEIANLPEYQNSYGNGFSGNFGWFFSNWGPAFDVRGSNGIAEDGTIEHPYDQDRYNSAFPEFDGARYEYRPYESVENFFEAGLSTNTSLSIENRVGENTTVSATYSYLNDEGFTPNLDAMRGGGPSNFLEKHNFGLGAQTKLDNGLQLRGTFNYVNSQRRVPVTDDAFGGAGSGLFAALLFTPRSVDLMGLPYQNPIDGSQVYYRRGSTIPNPRWVLNNAGEDETIQRFFGKLEASYEITPWLNAVYRVGIDQYQQRNDRNYNKGSGADFDDGIMQTSNRQNRITDQVANLLYDFRLSDNFTLDGVIGANFRKEVLNLQRTESTQQLVYGLFTHDNFINNTSLTRKFEENNIGVYGTASLGFRNFLYLNLQARNDWTSTLEKDNRSILYPSASLSFIPTDAFPNLTNSQLLNYFKVRVGYGTSAGYPDPYQTRNTLATIVRAYQTQGGAILNRNSVSNRLGNRDLTPELHSEIELGIEARFLYNRIGVDLSLYDKNSDDLIIDLDLDPATGFTNTTVNAAEIVNRGIELGLNFVPVRGPFTWEFTLNYTRNRSEVLRIAEGVDQIPIAGFTNLGNFAVVGEQYGIMQGTGFNRAPSGELLVNSVGSYTAAAGLQIIGDPNPNYTANWINNFSWKGLSFNFHWQYTDGGDLYSSTVQALLARGNTTDTDVDRFLPIILPGEKADGEPNDIQTYIGDVFFDAYFGADEGGVFDATVIRLREVSLSYELPQSLLTNTPFGNVSLQLIGRNLFYNAPNFPEGMNFDPEVLSLGVGNGRGFDFRTAPTSKHYGVTLSATF